MLRLRHWALAPPPTVDGFRGCNPNFFLEILSPQSYFLMPLWAPKRTSAKLQNVFKIKFADAKSVKKTTATAA